LYARMGYLVRIAELSGGREVVRFRASDEFLIRPVASELEARLQS